MLKRDYFVFALSLKLHLRKGWIISAFSVTRDSDNHRYPGGLVRGETGYSFYDRDMQLVAIESTDPNEPLFRFREAVILTAGDVENLSTTIDTYYGDAIVNALVISEAFGKKVPYMKGPITVKAIEKYVEPRLISDHLVIEMTDAPPRTDAILVSEWIRCVDALSQLAGLTSLCVVAATKKGLTPPPGIKEYRRKLIEERKDRLHDPATIAEIERLLIEYDKAYLAGDDVTKFYLKDKAYNIVRKKMYLSHGIETGFMKDGQIEFIENSLSEGWDVDKLPAMINSLRDGSYNRGAMTALGGWAVKFFYRILQNAKIDGRDCGSTLGVRRLIAPGQSGRFVGYYHVVGNKPVPITDQNHADLVGKHIILRSPMTCWTEGSGYCEVCMGDKNAANPTGLGASGSEVGSQFMGMFMAAMHGKTLATAKYSFKDALK